MAHVFFLPLAESPAKSHSRDMLRGNQMRLLIVASLTLGLPACSYFEKQEKMPPQKAAPRAVFVAPVAPPLVPAPPPEQPLEKVAKTFAVFGAVLGDACPRQQDMLAAYATCRNDRIIGMEVPIPVFDAAAKARIFARAIAKYGTPDEDRRGGLPKRVKVMMPDWAAMKTQVDLRPYRERRSAFWWVDEVAQHFISIEEGDEAVTLRVVLADPKARLDFDKQQAAQQLLRDKGSELTEKF